MLGEAVRAVRGAEVPLQSACCGAWMPGMMLRACTQDVWGRLRGPVGAIVCQAALLQQVQATTLCHTVARSAAVDVV